MTNNPSDFDGCNSECRRVGTHTLRWGGCERAAQPEPTVSMSKIYKDPEDGYPSIGFDSYTVASLADLVAPALLMPEEGFAPPYSESYARALAIVVAKAIVHRNDEPAPAVVSSPPATDRPAPHPTTPPRDLDQGGGVKPYRVLVTGSRTWDDPAKITAALGVAQGEARGRPMVVIHGACPTGADRIADDTARWMQGNGMHVYVERHPANWQLEGKRAGFIRNARMVNLGADVCLAFIKDGSRGASHTAALAEEAGIPVRRYTA